MTMQRLWPHFAQLGDGFAGGFSAELYDPVWLRCMDEVTARLKAMAAAGRLEDIAEASVVLAEQPDASMIFGSDAKSLGVAYPGIIVWPFQQENHEEAEGTNERDQIVYPVAISFVAKGSGITGENAMIVNRDALRQHTLWRERVSRRFRFGGWPTITEVEKSNVRYQLYAIPEQYRSNDLFHGAIIIDFTAWETRDKTDSGS